MIELSIELSKTRYMCFLIAMVTLLMSLFLLLSACTEEIISHGDNPPGSGKKVDVKFSLDKVYYKGNEVITRSKMDMIPETVVVPLGNGLNMYATLEVDHEVQTRATTVQGIWMDNTKLRIVAYANGDTYHTHADYTVNGNTLSGNPFQVIEGSYKFVAYAYNNGSLTPPLKFPDHGETIDGIDPGNYDLVWGCYPAEGTTQVTVATAELINISMTHLFSGVDISATTLNMGITPAPNITSIQGVSISGKKVGLTVKDGKFLQNNDDEKYFFAQDLFDGIGTPTVKTSNFRRVFTGNATSTVLHVENLTLNGDRTFSNLEAEFNKQLMNGVKYVLKVFFTNGTPPGTITVTEQLILAQMEQKPAIPKLTVECKKHNGDPDPDARWTLSVPQGNNWLTLSLSNNPANASKTVSGTGTQEIYVFVSTNALGSTVREENVVLSSDGVDIGATVIRQMKDLPPPETVSARASCVGAFWRHDQIGERIIQINMGANSGVWTALVSFYDSKWNPDHGDGVLLAVSGSSDPNIGTANPDNAENYNMIGYGYSNVINGTVSPGNDIVFRIGLQKTFDAYHVDNNPARYAVIELWYANHTKMQRIYLRQGEGPDYLMNRYAPDNRSAAVKFSPFNLTADTKNTAISASNPAKFTEYPTQVGAYFQWASNNRKHYAWAPHTTSVPNWDYYGANWDSSHETCPDGYRRPSDNGNDEGEIRQSLWSESIKNDVSNTKNYQYGYYADGFYDRRPINRTGGTNGIVAEETEEIAYGGGLFYNPTTNASIFFPITGYRDQNSGMRTNSGYWGYYLTTYQDGWTNAYALCMQNEGNLSMSFVAKPQGSNIRCVKIQ